MMLASPDLRIQQKAQNTSFRNVVSKIESDSVLETSCSPMLSKYLPQNFLNDPYSPPSLQPYYSNSSTKSCENT